MPADMSTDEQVELFQRVVNDRAWTEAVVMAAIILTQPGSVFEVHPKALMTLRRILREGP